VGPSPISPPSYSTRRVSHILSFVEALADDQNTTHAKSMFGQLQLFSTVCNSKNSHGELPNPPTQPTRPTDHNIPSVLPNHLPQPLHHSTTSSLENVGVSLNICSTPILKRGGALMMLLLINGWLELKSVKREKSMIMLILPLDWRL
jgi:hypothetical protein